MNCYFPMPFHKGARITLENQHEVEVPAFFYQVDYLLTDELPEDIQFMPRAGFTTIGMELTMHPRPKPQQKKSPSGVSTEGVVYGISVLFPSRSECT